jgi:hypothetical protein
MLRGRPQCSASDIRAKRAPQQILWVDEMPLEKRFTFAWRASPVLPPSVFPRFFASSETETASRSSTPHAVHPRLNDRAQYQ